MNVDESLTSKTICIIKLYEGLCRCSNCKCDYRNKVFEVIDDEGNLSTVLQPEVKTNCINWNSLIIFSYIPNGQICPILVACAFYKFQLGKLLYIGHLYSNELHFQEPVQICEWFTKRSIVGRD